MVHNPRSTLVESSVAPTAHVAPPQDGSLRLLLRLVEERTRDSVHLAISAITSAYVFAFFENHVVEGGLHVSLARTLHRAAEEVVEALLELEVGSDHGTLALAARMRRFGEVLHGWQDIDLPFAVIRLQDRIARQKEEEAPQSHQPERSLIKGMEAVAGMLHQTLISKYGGHTAQLRLDHAAHQRRTRRALHRLAYAKGLSIAMECAWGPEMQAELDDATEDERRCREEAWRCMDRASHQQRRLLEREDEPKRLRGAEPLPAPLFTGAELDFADGLLLLDADIDPPSPPPLIKSSLFCEPPMVVVAAVAADPIFV